MIQSNLSERRFVTRFDFTTINDGEVMIITEDATTALTTFVIDAVSRVKLVCQHKGARMAPGDKLDYYL